MTEKQSYLIKATVWKWQHKNREGIAQEELYPPLVCLKMKISKNDNYIEKKGKEKALFYCYHNKKRKISQKEKENK